MYSKFELEKIPQLRCDTFDNVTLLPMVGNVNDYRNTYALGGFSGKEPIVQAHLNRKGKISSKQLPYLKAWHKSEQEVIFGGMFSTLWGHFLIETLQRLWFTRNCNLPIVWTSLLGNDVFDEKMFTSWQKEIFQLLGIKNKHIFITEPTYFPKVHFPEPGIDISYYLHPEHAEFMGCHEGKTEKGKFVYFSRSNMKGCLNEKEVESLLLKSGWTIIHPEKVSVKQQVEALTTAEVCLMISGSAQHSLLLTKNLNTRFIVIPRIHHITYNIIANSKSDNYYLFDIDREFYLKCIMNSRDQFSINIASLQNVVEKTKNFTCNLENFSDILKKPEALPKKHFTVPPSYYIPHPPVGKGEKLFYKAVFYFKEKQYKASYHIFMLLRRENLLKDFMYEDFFRSVQYYLKDEDRVVTLSLEKKQKLISVLKEKITKFPKESLPFAQLNTVYRSMQLFDEAITLAEQAKLSHPNWAPSYHNLADNYASKGQWDKAIECVQEFIKKDSEKNYTSNALISNYYRSKKDYAAAIKLMEKAMLDRPQWSEPYAQFAFIHDAKGDLESAIVFARKASEIEPKNLGRKKHLCNLLRKKKDYAVAISFIEKTLQSEPRWSEAYTQLSCIYDAQGDLDKGLEYARKAMRIDPINLNHKTHLCNLLRKKKDYAKVIELMEEAIYNDPFWSEPYAQYALIYEAQEELDKAICWARKAVAIEPFNAAHRKQLENYKKKKAEKEPLMKNLLANIPGKDSPSVKRIQSYVDMFTAKTYLEVGVYKGHTFLNIDIPHKIAVDPNFQFDIAAFTHADSTFYAETSDVFFENFKDRSENLKEKYNNEPFKFDIIFLDGLHTYEQTILDFENSLSYSHDKTIWIIDDTVPSSYFSSIPSQQFARDLRNCAGISWNGSWHGDVFKTIFDIHDRYPNFSYCTQINKGNPQTILWRTEKPTVREKVFVNKKIEDLCYEDFLENVWVLNPVNDEDVILKLFSNINPLDFKTGEEYKKVVRVIVTDNEKKIAEENKKLKELEAEFEKSKNTFKIENEKLKQEIATMKKEQIPASSVQAVKNIIFQPFIKKKAFALCNSGKIYEAEFIAQSIIANNPYMAWAYYILAKVQWQQGKHDTALENLQKAINIEPQTAYFVKYRDGKFKNV